MGEYRQGKERNKIVLVSALYIVGAVICFILSGRVTAGSFISIVFIIVGLFLLYLVARQVIDYLSDPVIKIDEKGLTAIGYVPKSQDFSFTWEEVGKAFARAAGAGGGTCTFFAKDDPNKVVGVIHGYSRFVGLTEMRDLLKQYMGEAPSYG